MRRQKAFLRSPTLSRDDVSMELSRQLPIFLIGLVVGTVLSAAWFSGVPVGSLFLHPETTTVVAGSTTPPVAALPESGAISVSDQKAGLSVTVESVTVPPPGVWVAVREMSGATLGNVLGAARVQGPVSHLLVSLLRATVPGRTYAVTLYRDDSSGTFDANQDSIYVDFTTGQRVVALFQTIQ